MYTLGLKLTDSLNPIDSLSDVLLTTVQEHVPVRVLLLRTFTIQYDLILPVSNHSHILVT